MATIIEFDFLGKWINLDPPKKMSAKPKMVYKVSETDLTMDLFYEIVESGIDLEIVNPNKTVKLKGLSGSFAKQITFKQKGSGALKRCKLRVTAKVTGDSQKDTINVKV